ncbi:MAG: aminotransferase class I/II-fold pyridoxal phosphate-dependent enzyme, partial [Phaeodactylibacter sp.]|nr:aminotransferase class I/II-fold pyridoxal phosphate-dependent enzyme [Phaeodactylibacter sp.]
MPNNKIYLSSPHMGDAERRYVTDAFDTNWIAPLGPHVNAFEEVLAQYTGVQYAAALSSGTAAIHLALILLGVEAGDTVLCQSMTFSASANPIRYQGARPVFIDSEPGSWNMDPNALEDALKQLSA